MGSLWAYELRGENAMNTLRRNRMRAYRDSDSDTGKVHASGGADHIATLAPHASPGVGYGLTIGRVE